MDPTLIGTTVPKHAQRARTAKSHHGDCGRNVQVSAVVVHIIEKEQLRKHLCTAEVNVHRCLKKINRATHKIAVRIVGSLDGNLGTSARESVPIVNFQRVVFRCVDVPYFKRKDLDHIMVWTNVQI